MFRKGNVCTALLLGFSVSAVGCSGEEPSNGSLLEADQAPLEFASAKGQTFVRTGKIVSAKPNVDSTGAMIPPKPSTAEIDLGTLSDAELAKALAPKMAYAGYEYVAKAAPSELVRAVRANPNAVVGTMGFIPADQDVATESLSGKTVFSPDGRTLRRDNTVYPFRTVAYLSTGCTGTLVSASTVLTAAHCVHDGTNWMLPNIYPGVDIQDQNPAPYGSFGYCSITIPGAWDASLPAQYDFAVIETSPCGNYPGNTTGWLGVYATNTSGNISGTTSYLYGYPGDKSPYPQIWGMYDSSLRTSGTSVVYTIDTYSGQSGSAVYQFRSGSPCDGRCVVGIHRGQFDSDENHGRWIDLTVWQFIQDYSAL